KDRNRRYETAGALADELRRHLDNEPVLAGPPSASYRFRKFAARNKVPLAIAFLLGLLLSGAFAGFVASFFAVERERDRTRLALRAEGKRRAQARDALDATTSEMLGDFLARQTTLTSEHKTFLQKALEAYEEFASDTALDEESRAGAARAMANV